MKNVISILLLLGTMNLPTICIARELSVETLAYGNAVTFLKGTKQAYITNDAHARVKKPGKAAPEYVESPSDIIWEKNIAILAKSHRPEGSKYLARLAFFEQDGSYGEDFGCAVWRRGKMHPKEFLKYLREARDSYETMSPCLAPKFQGEKGEPALQCIPRDQYARLVQIHEAPESKEVNLEAEADCSHMFTHR